MAGDLTKDLEDPASWRLSNIVMYPGTPEGITRHLMERRKAAWRQWGKDGWLEANLVNVNGRLRVVSRCVIDGYATANIGGICDLEDDGKELKLSFAQFAAVPGGQCKFYIQFDPVSKLFWMASNIATDFRGLQDPLHASRSMRLPARPKFRMRVSRGWMSTPTRCPRILQQERFHSVSCRR